MNVSIGKAGRNRWMGWRGHVRGETDESGRPSARRPHRAAAGIR